MGRPKKRKREIEQARRHILRAAARVFAGKGFAAASMQEIAAEAGYSPPSLYSYFKGKQAILDSLLEQLEEESVGFFQVDFPSGLSLRQRLELLLMRQAEWVENNREAFVFFSRREGMAATTPSDPEAVPPHYVAQLAEWLAEHAGPDELHGHSSRMAAYLLWGIQHAMFTRWLAEHTPSSPRAIIPHVVSFFLHGLPGPAGTQSAAPTSPDSSPPPRDESGRPA